MSILIQIGNVTESTINVAYDGSKELNDESKENLGTYEQVAYQLEDKSAIYAQSKKDYEGQSYRSVILLNWQSTETWIGTVMIVLP